MPEGVKLQPFAVLSFYEGVSAALHQLASVQQELLALKSKLYALLDESMYPSERGE